MPWTDSDAMVVASDRCSFCGGAGIIDGRRKKGTPCACVWRNIFRACYRKFRACVVEERSFRPAIHEAGGRGARCGQWGFKDEEFAADFCLVSRRTLTEGEYRVFKYHFLLGADWRLCCRKLRIDRGTFFHAVYRIERKLGRTFTELRPYSLWPLDEYFHGTTHEMMPAARANVVAFRPVEPPTRLRSPSIKAA